jgi:hypothetical protein
VIESLETEAGLPQRAPGLLLAVETEWGVIGEIRTELEKEGTKVAVLAAKVVGVDPGGGTHDPGIGATGIRMAPLLGAEDGGFFLALPTNTPPWEEEKGERDGAAI